MDDWQGLGAIAAMVVEKMAAPAPREGETGAGAQAAWGQGRAQHHDTGRKGGVVIHVNFRPEGRTHRTNERSPMGGLRTTCPPVSPARLRG